MPYPIYPVGGFIGIGTPNPTVELDVLGDLNVSGAITSAGGSITPSFTAVGSTPNANGASVAGSVITLQPASGTTPGLITGIAQTISGAKHFDSNAGCIFGQVYTPWLFNDSSGSISIGGATTGDSAGAVGSRIGAAVALTAAGARLCTFSHNLQSYGTPTDVASVTLQGSYQSPFTDGSGTIGAQTINKNTGRFALDATHATFDITCNVCKTDSSSIVLAQVESADTTCKSVSITPGNGKFTVTASATPTAKTVVSFIVFNGV